MNTRPAGSNMPDCQRPIREERLLRLLADDLPEPEQSRLITHLDACASCRRHMESLAARSGLWDDLSLLRGESSAPPTDHFSSHSGSDESDDEEIPLGLLEPSGDPAVLGKLGGYDVLRMIGRGGMGIVFLARELALDRLVAIKLLTPGMAATGAARRRFDREARAAAAVVHDHVVTIHAVDTLPQGIPYLVMQYIPGKSAQELIDGGEAPTLAQILRIGSQAASALAAAHAQGLIHRDIKPANILLENGVERVKITDFGLARAVDDATMTQSGVVAGTPQYMSPEQAKGESIDHRTDLFSLGSVLYALCTGQAPFRGNSSMATLRKVCEQTPIPIQAFNPDIPPWLIRIINRLHAKDPADRYGSATEVADLLGRCLAHVQQPSGVPLPEELQPARNRKSLAIWGSIPVGLLLIGLLGFPTAREAAAQAVSYVATVLRLKTAQGTLVIETEDPGIGIRLDGNDLIVTGAGVKELRLDVGTHNVQAVKDGKILHDELVKIERGGREVLSVRREQDGPPPTTATIKPGQAALEFAREQASRSAKAAEIARQKAERTKAVENFLSAGDGGAKISKPAATPILPATVLPETTLPVPPNPRVAMTNIGSEVRSVAFSPDGAILAYGSKAGRIGFWYWQSQREQGTGMFSTDFDAHTGGVESVAISPNGRFLASCGWDHHVKLWDLLANPPGSPPKKVWDFPGFNDGVRSVAFSPDGNNVVAGGFDKQVVVLEARNGQRVWTSPAIEQPVNGVAISPDGRLIALAMGDYSKGAPGNPVGQPGEVQVWTWPGRKRIARLRGWKRECKSVAFSTDGKLLAATCADGTTSLYKCQTPSWEKVVLHPGPWPAGLAFRPDGSQLAISLWSGEVTLWDPLPREQQLALFKAHEGNIPSIAFSRDGQYLATGSADGSVKVWQISGTSIARAVERGGGKEAGQEVRRLADMLVRQPVSPSKPSSAQMRLYLRNLEDGKTTMVVDPEVIGRPVVEHPDWSHDGQRIVFHVLPQQGDWRGGRIRLVRSGDNEPVTSDLGPGCCPRFSPDDQTIAFAMLPGDQPGAKEGVWLMNADGTNRRRVAAFGSPFWSPDGKRLLINSPHTPTDVRILDLRSGELSQVRLSIPGQHFVSWPRWADDHHLVASLGSDESPNRLVLLDIHTPNNAQIERTYWRRSPGAGTFALWPFLLPATRDCFFIANEGGSRRIIAISDHGDEPGRRFIHATGGMRLTGLTSSPDGRYLIFAADEVKPTPIQSVRKASPPATDRLARVLRSNPPRHSAKTGERMQLYMRDRHRELVMAGPVTSLIVDEPIPGLTWAGAPDWSPDGTRIVFDASPGKDWVKSRLLLLEEKDGRPSYRDLGPGNCPKFSPDGKSLAFVLNPGASPGEKPGVYITRVDDTNLLATKRLAEDLEKYKRTVTEQIEKTKAQLLELARKGVGKDSKPKLNSEERESDKSPLTSPEWLSQDQYKQAMERLFQADLQLLELESQLETRLGASRVDPQAESEPAASLAGSSAEELRQKIEMEFKRDPAVAAVIADIRNIEDQLEHHKTLVRKGADPAMKAVQMQLRKLMKEYNELWDAKSRQLHQQLLTPANSPDLKTLADLKRKFDELKRTKRKLVELISHLKQDEARAREDTVKATFLNVELTQLQNRQEQVDRKLAQLRSGQAGDASERRHINLFGAPFWSLDGKRLLVNSFSDPAECTVYDISTGHAERILVPGQRSFSWPRWAGTDRLIACLGTEKEPNVIALIDISKPAESRVIETLWNRESGPDVYARWPLYDNSIDTAYFVGVRGKTRRLYTLVPSNPGEATPLEARGHEDEMGGLSFSPDGRFLLFGANRPDRAGTPEPTAARPAVNARELAKVVEGTAPPSRSVSGRRMQIYLRDLVEGRTTRIVDEPIPGLPWSATPHWSPDGTRILFDNSSDMASRSRLMLLEGREGKRALRDLGPGGFGDFSPDGRTIAFSINSNENSGEGGYWVMNADGTGRRRIVPGAFGAPFWSPGGDRLLLNNFEDPARIRIHFPIADRTVDVKLDGQRIFSWPSWAGPHTLVASLGSGDEPDAIALLDVSEPEKARIVTTLWKRSDGPNVYARWPVLSATGVLYFIGVQGPNLRAIYQVSTVRNSPFGAEGYGPAAPVEGPPQDDWMGGLSLSPGGEFLLFNANRPDRGTVDFPPTVVIPGAAAAAAPHPSMADSAENARMLADVLQRHPPKPGPGDGLRMQLYVRDILADRTSLIVDEPVPGLPWSAAPDWSHDGKRIVFDNSLQMVTRSNLMLLESRDGRPHLRDLGPGVLGKFSPDDRRIAFAINPADNRDEAGIWIMNADGTDRRRLIAGEFGAPSWSTDRRQLLINTWADPAKSLMYDFSTQEMTQVQVQGNRIFSWPTWSGPHSLVASVGNGDEPDSIVVLDVTRPEKARVTRKLWKRRDGPDVYARWPILSASRGLLYFLGAEGHKRSILQVPVNVAPAEAEATGRALPVEGSVTMDWMGGLNLSPDGRYLIFNANRPDRAKYITPPMTSVPREAAADADRLADTLKRAAPRPSGNDGVRMQLYLRDLKTDDVHLIVDEPRPGLTRTSMPSWSHDGQRIAFHATPQNDWQKAEMFALRDAGQKPVLQPLGAGSCPAYSPDDRSIAFLVWPGAKAGEEAGVHLMHSDGTDRRRIGGIGAPYWSPDGKRLLINPFTEPTVSTILDLPTDRQDLIQVPGYQLVSWPRWIGKDRVVAVVHQGDSLREAELVVLDVGQPSRASIVESLWKRTPELDILPRWPIYRASADEYLFAGVREPFDRNLFRLAPRREAFPTPLQGRFHPDQLEGLVLSPGDRYLVFNANRPDRMTAELNPAVRR